jgi:hypothetical protein
LGQPLNDEWIDLDEALRLYCQRLDISAEEYLPMVNRSKGEKTLDVYLRDVYFVAYRMGEGYYLDRRMFMEFLQRMATM